MGLSVILARKDAKQPQLYSLSRLYTILRQALGSSMIVDLVNMERAYLTEPPERGHPDRKRALGVLAQRRYRACPSLSLRPFE